MSFRLFHVDAFTQFPFSGNPASVCVLPSPADETWMQRVASEINLSETAFICKKDSGSYFLRWFAPKGEVDLCGHATLASAHVLWNEGLHPYEQKIRFVTNSGMISCEVSENWIQMKFPVIEFEEEDLPKGIVDSIGIVPKFCAKTSLNDFLPKEIINKKKWGFSVNPYLQFNKDIKSTIEKILTKEYIHEQGIFYYSYIKSILDYKPHPKLRWHYNFLWILTGLAIWEKMYIKTDMYLKKNHELKSFYN